MNRSPDWASALQEIPRHDWPEFLNAHSGLPGPRANLSLLRAAVELGDADLFESLVESDEEYGVMCAAAWQGTQAWHRESLQLLRTHALDDRWRVREGVAIGLQILGDRDPATLIRIARDWALDSEPLRQRAAVVAICEPRLLTNSATRNVALEVCRSTTEQFGTWGSQMRRSPDARNLRQALGYCWSVVVASDTDTTLDVFLALDRNVPDIDWIVRQNLRKKRLSQILPSATAPN